MTTQWTCTQCHMQNSAEMRFCPHCGAARLSSTETTAETPPAAPPPSTGSNRRLLWVVAGVVWLLGCVVLGIGGYLWWDRDTAGLVLNEAEKPALVAATPTAAATVEAALVATEEVRESAVPTATAINTPEPTPTVIPAPTPVSSQTPGATVVVQQGDNLFLKAGPAIPAGDIWAEANLVKQENEKGIAQPSLATDEAGRIFMAYNALDQGIKIIWSDDNGSTWSPPAPAIDGAMPKLLVNQERWYLFYLDKRPDQDSLTDLHLIISDDNGETWSTARTINEVPKSVYGDATPAVAVGPDEIMYVMWSDGEYVYFSKSDDRGRSWSPNQQFRKGIQPQLALDNSGNLYAVWTGKSDGQPVMFAATTNQGESWTSSTAITDNEFSNYPFGLAVSDAGTLYVLWQTVEKKSTSLSVAISSDSGEKWQQTRFGLLSPLPFIIGSKVIVSGDYAYLIWLNASDPEGLYFSRSLDDGRTWSGEQVIDGSAEMGFTIIGAIDAALVSDGSLYVARTDPGNNDEAAYNIFGVASQPVSPEEWDEILSNPPTPTVTATPTPRPAAAAPRPVAPANCPNPGVQITNPVEGSAFRERRVFIIGNANIPDFHHWKLEYSTVNDGHTWMYLFERDYPVNNDKLMMLDTSTVPRGPYGLRLTVVDQSGNYPEPCVVWFTNGQ